jgi:hypothetical protein
VRHSRRSCRAWVGRTATRPGVVAAAVGRCLPAAIQTVDERWPAADEETKRDLAVKRETVTPFWWALKTWARVRRVGGPLVKYA